MISSIEIGGDEYQLEYTFYDNGECDIIPFSTNVFGKQIYFPDGEYHSSNGLIYTIKDKRIIQVYENEKGNG